MPDTAAMEQTLADLQHGRSRFALPCRSQREDLHLRIREAATWCAHHLPASAVAVAVRQLRLATRMKNSIEAFADEALRFERWLLEGSDRGAAAAMAALRHLLALYGAALNLPTGWSEPGDPVVEVTPPGEAEWQRAYEAARRLPIDFYGLVFNPAVVPPEEPCVGSVADDLADICRDISGGLRVFEQGNHAAAAWEWTVSLHSHWGAHATGAIHALHWWLAQNRRTE